MIEGKVIIVTGASSGIGKEMAITFSNMGANVVLAARREKRMYEFSDQLKGDWLIVPTDVKNYNSVKRLMKTTVDKYGRIDILINNAGYADPVGILEMTLKQWHDMIETNLTGTFLCTKEAVKYMKKTGGKIINIASMAGTGARPGWSAYAASKAGVINFSLTMAEELKIYGIKVFCICPGRTATALRKKLVPDEDLSKIMKPSAVVNIVKFCLSDEADVIDAQPILVRER